MKPRAPSSKTKPPNPRADPSLIEYLEEIVHEATHRWAGVLRKKMLVSTGWSVNDRVFAVVSRQARIVVKLPDEASVDELLSIEGAERWKFGTRAPPKGWLLLPEARHDDIDFIATWLERAWRLGREASSSPSGRGARNRKPTAVAADRTKMPIKHRTSNKPASRSK